jgi:YHS domain-containing protein
MSIDLKARALARWESEGGAVLKPTSASLNDPVCGMTVTAQSPHRHVHEARAYFFCSDHCRLRFAAEPLEYVARAAGRIPDRR